jgi:hypothetical protein
MFESHVGDIKGVSLAVPKKIKGKFKFVLVKSASKLHENVTKM